MQAESCISRIIGSFFRDLEQHQNANQSYLQEGVAILELANRAAELFEKQSASEKRRLLDFVLSNSSWGDGELTVEFRQPFDLIAVGATELKQNKGRRSGLRRPSSIKYTREECVPPAIGEIHDRGGPFGGLLAVTWIS